MKICFSLQRRFARVGHAIAANLKNNHGIENFCAYVQTRAAKKFLEEQNDTHYSALLLDEDIHNQYANEKIDLNFLNTLDKKYGIPNLWPYLAIDRTLMYSIMPREYPSDKPLYTHEEMLQILQVYAKSVLNFLKKEKPDAVCFSVVGSVGSMILYHFAKKMGIKTLFLYLPGIENRIVVTEDYNKLTWSEKLLDKIAIGQHQSLFQNEAQQFIKNFRENPQPYHEDVVPEKTVVKRWMQLKFLLPWSMLQNIAWFLKLVFKKQRDYTEEKPLWFFTDRLKRKFRTFVGYYDLCEQPKNDEDFAFFPLQPEPEISLYVWSYFWTNQIELARNIARALPVHFKLYIKEHPSMFGFRTRRFYKELKKIPNVRLIDPRLRSYALIKKAKLVTVIANTVGWESVVFKKPVITFGNIFYNKLSFVKNCKAAEDLPAIVQEQLNNFKYDEDEAVNFLAAIMENSVLVDWIDLWHKEQKFERIKSDAGIRKLADLIHKKLCTKNS